MSESRQGKRNSNKKKLPRIEWGWEDGKYLLIIDSLKRFMNGEQM